MSKRVSGVSGIPQIRTSFERFLSESTMHSTAHYLGERKFYVKFIWFAAFIISFVFCGIRIQAAFTKYLSRDISTTIKEAALDFEFPDVYICNENPISGSFSVTLNPQNADVLKKFKLMVNSSVQKTYEDNFLWLEEYTVRMINTLPYRFLSDFMGHQHWQSIIDFTVNEAIKRKSVVLYHHNAFVNCLFLNLNETDRNLLKSPSSRLSLTLFLDPQLPAQFDNSSQQDVIGLTNVKPYDWDFNYGYDYTRATGFRLFATPRGHQPNEWSTQTVLGAGRRSEVEFQMEETFYNPEDFVGKCLDIDSSVASVEYVNPYTRDKEVFGYEAYACLHRELARLSVERLNYTVFRSQQPWIYREVPSCFNLTVFSALSSTSIYEYAIARGPIMTNALELCRGKSPCRRKTYTFKQFSTAWPSERLLNEYLLNYVDTYMVKEPAVENKTHLPGIKYFLNESTTKSKDFLLQLTLTASDEKSSEVQLSISYSANSLIADVGGLLGLFLGMSLLSLLELVELLHDCILVVIEQIRTKEQSVDSSQSVAGNETAVEIL